MVPWTRTARTYYNLSFSQRPRKHHWEVCTKSYYPQSCNNEGTPVHSEKLQELDCTTVKWNSIYEQSYCIKELLSISTILWLWLLQWMLEKRTWDHDKCRLCVLLQLLEVSNLRTSWAGPFICAVMLNSPWYTYAPHLPFEHILILTSKISCSRVPNLMFHEKEYFLFVLNVSSMPALLIQW